MKIFSWMRNKRHGKEGSNSERNPQYAVSHDMVHQSCKEEFSDWPNGLLAIGTFGNNNLKHSDKLSIEGIRQDHLENSSREDFEEVDKQLRLLLTEHISSVDSSFSGESDKYNPLVEKFLDCLREDEKQKTYQEIHSQRTTSSVVHKKRGISKKSLSFLLKKALLCRGGFVPAPTLRDPLPDPTLDNSRLEKILRAMLHKKIYPQRPSPQTNSKQYLDVAEECEEANHQSKWVKTDSEYIVLEI